MFLKEQFIWTHHSVIISSHHAADSQLKSEVSDGDLI